MQSASMVKTTRNSARYPGIVLSTRPMKQRCNLGASGINLLTPHFPPRQ